jgi:hypothetical protein
MTLFDCLWLFVELIGLGCAFFSIYEIIWLLCLAIGHCVKCPCLRDEVKCPCDGDNVKCPYDGDELSIYCRYTNMH